MNEIETVKLRNGTEEARPLVAVVRMSLEKLLKDKPIVLYELVEICRDPKHVPWGIAGDDLVALNLIGRTQERPQLGPVEVRYTVHQSIRNIVLACVEGEDMDMRSVSPVAK